MILHICRRPNVKFSSFFYDTLKTINYESESTGRLFEDFTKTHVSSWVVTGFFNLLASYNIFILIF